jgi:hypothetical protein
VAVVESLREAKLGDYVPFEGFREPASGGVIECIPKLTQALLVPRNVVRERHGKVDDHLLPLIFAKEGPYRDALDRALGAYKFSTQVEDLLSEVASAPKRHHEELAALVAGVQGVLVATGRASIVGCTGVWEGYFALPPRENWNPDWSSAFESTRAEGVEVIDLGSAVPFGTTDSRSVAPRSDTPYGGLVDELKEFVKQRDWEQFHSPKSPPYGLIPGTKRISNMLTPP